MLRLASDADVKGAIVRGLLRRQPDLDLIRSQDELPEGTPDPEVLAWAATEDRILITHDRSTMLADVNVRIASGEAVPGIIVTNENQPVRAAIEDILLIAECLSESEVRDRVVIYLPYRG